MAMKSRESDFMNSKLEMVKTIGTPRKILLNIKINQPKLVNICGYKLATNLQKFMEINLL